jgi:hypothetical protein
MRRVDLVLRMLATVRDKAGSRLRLCGVEFENSLPSVYTVCTTTLYLKKMGIHTGRYAVAVSMLEEALGGSNATMRDIAYSSFSWASYCTQADG